MLVAAYTAGLTGTVGREVRLRAPETNGEAVRIATMVEQAELQERRNDSFYLDSGRNHARWKSPGVARQPR